ncbi:hypothetical protein O181_077281 [Austropuccinia psidii MF-1]|uniref:Uncharacterized protein n=1 Tax=Austropuccinia psidii MF-1 TaxID=1389203 RepID=A0A9Q3IBY5_9BASI|nr:hypothetical protein [Austropuccinia psidii MF-1]
MLKEVSKNNVMEKHTAIMRLARELAIRSEIVRQSHPDFKNEGMWMHLGFRGCGNGQYSIHLVLMGWNLGYMVPHMKKGMKWLIYGGMPPHRQFLTLVQAPDASHVTPYASPGSQHFIHKFLCLTLHTPFLKLGQVPNASHAIPYAGPGSQCFTCKSLHPIPHTFFTHQSLHQMLHMSVLTRDASHTNPYAQRSTCNSLCFFRFLTHHTQILMLLRLILGDIRTGNDSCISGGFLICGEPQVF